MLAGLSDCTRCAIDGLLDAKAAVYALRVLLLLVRKALPAALSQSLRLVPPDVIQREPVGHAGGPGSGCMA